MKAQKKNMVVMNAKNKLDINLLRALLITFGFVSVIGLIWYSNTLSKVTYICGITSCIAAFSLGFIKFSTKGSAIRTLIIIVLSAIGILASMIRIYHDSNMLRDIWGAIPHFLSLFLFVAVLVIVLRSNN
ncbi:hypothetical protein [Desulfofustis glycolicus]|uniref:Uncharacterized protein n=1 Tax=Desulfofustis glycolicus DSM 9705 TaxID=1121409 RepID=A0A1M5XTF6_9BACT|nr:hypothetical protein [Desulfofustis glycolicus]MCB2217241.1 hypothetical protein [Desulfobulbaceae bacterium]SHI03039.1 hypothetical protein SAMN02745124_03327 [Desulfofustis glycolicus DSM 9705]